MIAACLVHQGILNIGILMSFPFAFLKVGKVQVRKTVGLFLETTHKQKVILSKEKREPDGQAKILRTLTS